MGLSGSQISEVYHLQGVILTVKCQVKPFTYIILFHFSLGDGGVRAFRINGFLVLAGEEDMASLQYAQGQCPRLGRPHLKVGIVEPP